MSGSVPHAAVLEPCRHISDFVSLHALERPDADAMVVDDRRYSYAEFHERVESMACALLAHGVRRGDRVATLCTPHPEYFIAFLATASIGGIWLGLNPRYSREELLYAVCDAEPTILLARSRIGERSYAGDVAAMKAATPGLQHIVALDDPSALPCSVGLETFLRNGRCIEPVALTAARTAVGRRDPCLLVYTSGSTGRPKGALLHHEGLVLASLRQNAAWPVSDTRFLNYFPVNHVGCVCDVSCPTLAAGGCIVFMEQFEPARSLELMVRERITVWASVPTVFQLQLALPDFDRYDLSAVELIVWEGAAMPVDSIQRLRRILPRLATNFSMTESTTAITVVAPTDDIDVLANSVGVPFDDVKVRLLDEHGRTVASGQPGELQACSPYNMLGYWRRPEDTAATITSDGWLRTGDLAVQRPDGRYRIVGRLKEMYKSGGYNVYPREVEAVLEAHPAVELAAVVSRPDPVWQEVGVAFVRTRAPVTPAEIETHCCDRLANYKRPKSIVICAELPLLSIGKVDKVALRRRAADAGDADSNGAGTVPGTDCQA